MKIEGGRAVVHTCQPLADRDFAGFQAIFKDYSTHQNNNNFQSHARKTTPGDRF